MFFLIVCVTGEVYVSTNANYVPAGKTVARTFAFGTLTPTTHQVTTIGGTTGAYTAAAYAGNKYGYVHGTTALQVI